MAESNQNGFGSVQFSSNSEKGQEFKSGKWTREEDLILRDYVRVNGVRKWNLVHKITGLKRDGASCRHRWTNHLKPGLKQGAFSEYEKELIIKLHAKHGSNWGLIAAKLPGRSNNAIKNFCNNQLRKTQKQGGKQKEPGSVASLFSTSSSPFHSGVQKPIDKISFTGSHPVPMSTLVPNAVVYDKNFLSSRVHLENDNSLPLNSLMPLSLSTQLIPFKPFDPRYHSYNSSSVVEGELPPVHRSVAAGENNGFLDAICDLACGPILGGSFNTTAQEGIDRGKGNNVDYVSTYRINRNEKINIAEGHWHEMKTLKRLRLNNDKCEDMESLDKHIFGIVDTATPLVLDGIDDGNSKSSRGTRGYQIEDRTATDEGGGRGVEAFFFQQSSGDTVADEYVGLEWFSCANGWNDYFGQ